ncbi:ABC transporter substrate-binding protein [Radicibacter daui]|uniref:ABC transporter substrate-binding protein n=1 Tax=Radicibacter daui TaxID=3064829 RepID=UPI004046D65E
MKKLLLAALLGASLAGLGAPAVAATPKDSLVVAKNIDDMISLDPAEVYEFTGGEITTNLYDGLVRYDADDTTKLVGGLAESWSADPAGRSITFKLRKGVTFASGNPVTADDVVWSYARVVTLNKPPAFIFTQLGWKPDTVATMVTKVGEDSVKISYDGDYSPDFVLNCLAARVGMVVDMKTAMAHEKDGDLGNGWLNRNSAGTGPFVLKLWKANESVVMEANPHYRGKAPAMKRVIYRHVPEPSTQRLMLEKGDVDIARDLGPDQIAGLAGNDKIKVETYPQSAVYFLSLNQKSEKLQNPAVWEAMRWLIDYQGMVGSFLKGGFEVHQAFWPKGFAGSLDDTPYKLDVDKAKKILADAGIDHLDVTMDMINSAPFPDIAQSIQSTFAKAGIKVSLMPGTGSQVITRYRAREHELMLLYWGPDYMDANSNAMAFAFNADNSDDHYASSTTWRNAWIDKDLSEKTVAALKEPDREKRLAMYKELQLAVQQHSPIINMFQNTAQVALASDVKGYVQGVTSDLVFYRNVEK